MNEFLTRAELETRYDGEWVLLRDPQVDEQRQVTGGWVIAHGPDRDEVMEAAMAHRGKVRHFASLCFVKEPANMEYIL